MVQYMLIFTEFIELGYFTEYRIVYLDRLNFEEKF